MCFPARSSRHTDRPLPRPHRVIDGACAVRPGASPVERELGQRVGVQVFERDGHAAVQHRESGAGQRVVQGRADDRVHEPVAEAAARHAVTGAVPLSTVYRCAVLTDVPKAWRVIPA